MELFVSDLDNTLIYSYKRDIGRNKVLVETKDGKELSYMTELSNRILREAADRYCFVPCTTRSLEQYKRIVLFADFTPQYALVSNGGILLRHGMPDAEWYEESMRLCRGAEKMLVKAEGLLKEDRAVSIEIHRVDGLFVFTKSDAAEQTMARLKDNLDENEVDVLNNGSKVYVVPRILNKGTAVRRLKELTGANRVVAAGDSEFDIPMLLEADTAWFPEALDRDRLAEHPGKQVVPGEAVFSDQLLRSLL